MDQASALADLLTATDDPAQALDTAPPCAPLDLLIALHAEVLRAMMVDPPRAARAAAAARLVAGRHPGDPLLHAQAEWSSGNAVLYVPDYAAALAHYEAALAHYAAACARWAPAAPPRDVRAVHVNRVFCLGELGRYEQAAQAVAAAEAWLAERPNAYARLTLLLNRSLLAGATGNYAQMVALADETVALAMEEEYPDRAAQGWVNRASACVFLGRYAEAEAAVARALAFAAECDDQLTAARAQVARAMLLQAQGQLFAALGALRAAAEGFAQAPGETATVLLEEAAISAQLQQWAEALEAARSAARRFDEQRLPSYSAEAALRAARIAARRGKARAARDMLALARRQLSDGAHPLLAPEADLTDALLATLPAPDLAPATLLRRRKAARAHAHKAVARLRAAGLAQAAAEGLLIVAALETQVGRPEAAIGVYRALTAAEAPGVRLAALGALGALLPPAEALPTLEAAARLAVDQRRALPMEEIQARYSVETTPHHMRLATCALALGDVERAAAAIWEAKAGPILDLRAAGAAATLPPDPFVATAKADLGRLRRLADEQTRGARRAADQGQHERAASHLAQAQAATAQIERRAAELTARLRALGDRGGQRQPPELPAVQAALGPATALLEWFQVDDAIWAMLVTAAGPPRLRRVTEKNALAALLDRWNLVAHRYRGAAQAGGAAALRQALAPLEALLLGPWRTELAPLAELIVAPAGALYQVPWVALGALHHEALVVTLTPSGGLWAMPLERGAEPSGPPLVLGYAGEGDERLIHLDAELDAVAAHLPEARLVRDAGATALRTERPPLLLHLGAHARSHPSAPLCSTIELADGPLLLHEAHRLNLRGTALVVLSACETAARPDHGDMALALAGAFLCAGAGAVIASLWPVDDAATAAIMEQLYARLAAGHTPADALHLAQHAVRAAYPLDWAAFQLWVGAREAVAVPLPLHIDALGTNAPLALSDAPGT